MVVFRRKIRGAITAWWEWLRGEVDELESWDRYLRWVRNLVGSGNLIFPPLTIHSRTITSGLHYIFTYYQFYKQDTLWRFSNLQLS